MLSNTELNVWRVGVDEHPLSLRFGARMFWSEHEEGGEKYWKHIVRLYPVGKGASKTLDMASGVIQDNLAAMVVQLSTRLNLLVSRLAESKAISSEIKDEILNNELKDKKEESDWYRFWDRLEQVADAETYGM